MDPKSRFSSRVDDYVKYRPTYPDAVLDVCWREMGLTPAWAIADIGAGTGISAGLFLRNGNPVTAIEPNAAMRAAAERSLSQYPQFRATGGSAEATDLDDGSVDLIVAAQAFHWFDRAAARREFLRVLRRETGWVLLMWNDRKRGGTPFLDGYEALLDRFGTDYHQVHQANIPDSAFAEFFGRAPKRIALPNHQELDEAALLGRAFSSSYTPLPGQPGHAKLAEGLRDLFARTQQGGVVRMEYEVELYLGRLTE